MTGAAETSERHEELAPEGFPKAAVIGMVELLGGSDHIHIYQSAGRALEIIGRIHAGVSPSLFPAEEAIAQLFHQPSKHGAARHQDEDE